MEFVESLNVSDFILCFRTFSVMHGVPGLVVPDNAKTFVAANSFLKGRWLVKRLGSILRITTLSGGLIHLEPLVGWVF